MNVYLLRMRLSQSVGGYIIHYCNHINNSVCVCVCACTTNYILINVPHHERDCQPKDIEVLEHTNYQISHAPSPD